MDAHSLLARMREGAMARRPDGSVYNGSADAHFHGGIGILREYDQPHIERQHGEQLVQTLVDEQNICWRVTVQRVN